MINTVKSCFKHEMFSFVSESVRYMTRKENYGYSSRVTFMENWMKSREKVILYWQLELHQ